MIRDPRQPSMQPTTPPVGLSASAAINTVGPSSERQVMEAWERFVAGLSQPSPAVSKFVLSSWQRSLRSGVEPGSRLAPMSARGDALAQLRLRNADLIWAAQGLFISSAHLLAASGSIMLLTDPDGIVLETAGNPRTLEAAQDNHLVEGGNWHEGVIGTNGIGTALARRAPTLVHAAEHFCVGIKRWTCAAAPVFSPGTDRIIGVLDISGPPSTYQVNNLALAVAAARQIEAVLAERASCERYPRMEACLSLSARTDSAAMMVLDRSAQLIHASGNLPSSGLRLGNSVPGLKPGRQVEDWARHLPEGLRPEWLHPVRVNGKDIGALLAIPRRSSAGPRLRTSSTRLAMGAFGGVDGATDGDPSRSDFANLIGHSQALRAAVERAKLLSHRRVAVLIQGETGVGKELFARAIHGDEERSGPFVIFNCGASTKELIGSELFGHVRGAYTGATTEGRAGRFELAHGGTLCLDEIGELALELQPVLLRVLEEGVVYRLGESKPRRVDVRLLAMTNRDLLQEVEAGRFRRDLYHRISVTRIQVPPLRERAFDIDLLIDHFNEVLAERHGVASRHFGPEVRALLRAYAWPGNVRELRNVVEGLLLTSDEVAVSCAELPEEIAATPTAPVLAVGMGASSARLEESERQAILQAVQDMQGNLAQAARALGISRSTLYRKIERYHLQSIVHLRG